MGCVSGMIKYLLFATNFLIFALGLVCLGFGIFALVDDELLSDFIGILADDPELQINVYSTAAILIIVVSSFVVLTSFLGCCGAIKENKCMLGIYIMIIVVIFAAMIAGAVLGYSVVFEEIEKGFYRSLERYDPNASTGSDLELKDAWDETQTEYKCCGVDKFSDWEMYNSHYNGTATKVPASCCDDRDLSDAQEAECQQNPTAYTEQIGFGCWETFKEDLDEKREYILGGTISIIVVMALGLLFAIVTCSRADKHQYA